MGSTGDLWRCELCRHGPACGRHRTGVCGYAHSLAELLPPRERDREYLGVWRNGVDRYFGQHMNKAQLDRIMFYYNRTPVPERPVWSSCMAWFYQYLDLRMLPELGWDFGLWQDVFKEPLDDSDCSYNHHLAIPIMSCIIVIVFIRTWTC